MTLVIIRNLCLENNICIADLEKAVGLSNGSICKWEGKNPGVENVRRVADYFGVTVDELLATEAHTGQERDEISGHSRESGLT